MLTSFFRDSYAVLDLLCLGFLLVGMVSCSGQSEREEPAAQTPPNTNQALLDALDGHTETIVLGDAGGPQVVLTPELSARVLGASIGGAGDENLMWVDETVMNGTYWSKSPRFWNAGGLRTWVAPEDLFFVNARKDPESWFVPPALDPVAYRVVAESGNAAEFETDIELPANIGKTYSITLHSRIELLTDPPAEAGPLPAGVSYMGIGKEHSLRNNSDMVIGEDLPYVCLWSLLQLRPAGTTLVPVKEGVDPEWAYREYFNPLGDRLAISGNIISVKIDGKYRLKIGVRPEAAGKGIAFLRDDGDGSGVLFVKLFPVEPDGVYVDKPWGKESDYGDAIELYNDDGNMGGFTEIECHGPAKKLKKGESQSHGLKLHIFRGPIPELVKIGSALLGADLSRAKFF